VTNVPSITSWMRLEPRARSEAMRASLCARVHDPLWLLARQWQFGEFKGEDAGSPVIAALAAQRSPVTRYAPGRPRQATTGVKYDPATLPLEVMVEREKVRSTAASPTARDAAQAGMYFFHLMGERLTDRYRSAYLAEYALEEPSEEKRMALDGASLRFLDLMVGRVVDGGKLYLDLHNALRSGTTPQLPANPTIQTTTDAGQTTSDAEQIKSAALVWLQWYDELFSQPTSTTPSAWVAERFEYECAVAAPVNVGTSTSEVTLVAPEYAGGHLDWYSFDVATGVKLGAAADGGIQTIERSVLPTAVVFGGMPSSRWWEFEDRRVNFGAVDAAPEDLARLLVLEFALIYGNDFFVIPLELPVGSLCRITKLEVFDTFGFRTTVGPAAAGNWRMFELRTDQRMGAPSNEAGLFFLPPALGASLESEPVEEVLLTRDEMANMAWAVEKQVEGSSGAPVNRLQALQEMRRRDEREREAADPGSTAPRAGPLAYRVMTEAPANWIPLVPVRISPNAGREIGFERREFTAPPLGRLLEPDRPLILNEEELPRAGVRLTRGYQYARWTDGSTHLWLARRKQTGRGEGSSGLRFDVVESQ
jgi:hypothetical protein